METYTFLRGLADSWFLLLMTLFFVGVVIYTFRPGSRKTHEDISRIPFRHEDAPAENGEKNG
jgi:cytochrome c oxidase cbb3-type subunit IV